MKKTMMALALLLATLNTQAQSMRQLWIEMPDSLTEYLNRSLRTELADYVDMGLPPEVTNKLQEKTTVDSLTKDYMNVRLSAALRMELKKLPRNVGDSVIAMVRTYYGPLPMSVLTCYDCAWNRIDGELVAWPDEGVLLQRPDSMSVERFDELRSLMEMKWFVCHLSPTDNSLTVSLSVPMLTRDEEKDFQSLLRQTNLKWDGKTFK